MCVSARGKYAEDRLSFAIVYSSLRIFVQVLLQLSKYLTGIIDESRALLVAIASKLTRKVIGARINAMGDKRLDKSGE